MQPGSQESSSWLLLLPEAALDLVLQKLLQQDQYSLFNLVKSCTRLKNAIPVHNISRISLTCWAPWWYDSFTRWLQQHNTSLTSLTECSIKVPAACRWRGEAKSVLGHLPCPQLRQLHLENVTLLSDPAGGCPSALQDCTRLTALSLKGCTVPDLPALLAALPDLQSLRMSGC
jgi:Leucine-rich repeat (LRR) protein